MITGFYLNFGQLLVDILRLPTLSTQIRTTYVTKRDGNLFLKRNRNWIELKKSMTET